MLANAIYAPRSFNSIRSYYFRSHCAQIDRENREFGGPSLAAYTLEDFRILFAAATSQAVTARQRELNRYDHATRSWDRPFRRIVR